MPPAEQAEGTDLDDRILGVVIEKARPRTDVLYGKGSPQDQLLRAAPLIGSLCSLLTTARPLRPTTPCR
ncbi:hypothetical protein [Amycolatopsis sp. cmx-11-51]|uniref:hypothetical protein n=1 Tax=unclassified Amycolatopsis TaxID=2618356 RepID=UPI0039E479C5